MKWFFMFLVAMFLMLSSMLAGAVIEHYLYTERLYKEGVLIDCIKAEDFGSYWMCE